MTAAPLGREPRYAGMDHGRLLCRDCSTRTTGVLIPGDERAEHDEWHKREDRRRTAELERDLPPSLDLDDRNALVALTSALSNYLDPFPETDEDYPVLAGILAELQRMGG